MTIQQPLGTDPLNIPDHALSHRVFANDDMAPEESVVVDSAGDVTTTGNLEISKATPVLTLTDSGSTNSADLTKVATINKFTLTNDVLQPSTGLGYGVNGTPYILPTSDGDIFPAYH